LKYKKAMKIKQDLVFYIVTIFFWVANIYGASDNTGWIDEMPLINRIFTTGFPNSQGYRGVEWAIIILSVFLFLKYRKHYSLIKKYVPIYILTLLAVVFILINPNNTDDILKQDVIIIDGGNALARRRAGFALLFRFIVSDKWGLYKECVALAHKFEMLDSSLNFTRNDWVDVLKTQDVIFISEFEPSFFNEHFWVGTFFDEFLVTRSMDHKSTIISFSYPLSKETILKNTKCGRCIADFSARINPSRQAFRVRVKPYEPK